MSLSCPRRRGGLCCGRFVNAARGLQSLAPPGSKVLPLNPTCDPMLTRKACGRCRNPVLPAGRVPPRQPSAERDSVLQAQGWSDTPQAFERCGPLTGVSHSRIGPNMPSGREEKRRVSCETIPCKPRQPFVFEAPLQATRGCPPSRPCFLSRRPVAGRPAPPPGYDYFTKHNDGKTQRNQTPSHVSVILSNGRDTAWQYILSSERQPLFSIRSCGVSWLLPCSSRPILSSV